MGASGLEDRDDEGWTALLNAAYWGQDEILRFLLLAGADHTITDKEGATARALAEEEDEEQHNDTHKEGKVRCVAVLEVSISTHVQVSTSVVHSMASQKRLPVGNGALVELRRFWWLLHGSGGMVS
jgi:hypothetical protein